MHEIYRLHGTHCKHKSLKGMNLGDVQTAVSGHWKPALEQVAGFS